MSQALARQPKAPAQGPATTGVSEPMTLADFKAEMTRYGVTSVAAADWSPGEKASIYRSIADAFADVAAGLGGVPPVKEVVFRKGEAGASEAASFSGGRLEVYDLAERRNKWLPAGRSEQGGSYEVPPGGQLSGVEGQEGGAPLPLPSRAASERRVIAHELGHAVVEGMLTPGVKQADALDKGMITRFKKAVGWYGDELFDIQDPAVRKAIQEEDKKPSAAPITGRNWNSPKWGEQPITNYVLTGAHEDFPESLMAYLYAPQLLKVRSPARFAFMAENKAKWGPILASPAGKKAALPPGSSRPALRRPRATRTSEGAPYRRTRPTPRRSSARATISRWTSLVPSQMRSTRSSRQSRSATLSRR